MNRRIDAHRNFVGILAGDALVHFKQIVVPLPDALISQALERVGEIQVYAEPRLSDAAAFIADGFRVARSDVARH